VYFRQKSGEKGICARGIALAWGGRRGKICFEQRQNSIRGKKERKTARVVLLNLQSQKEPESRKRQGSQNINGGHGGEGPCWIGTYISKRKGRTRWVLLRDYKKRDTGRSEKGLIQGGGGGPKSPQPKAIPWWKGGGGGKKSY